MPTLDNRPDLTPPLAQHIVVVATPHPGHFTGPDQPLFRLGVIDPPEASLHAARIQTSLNKIGWRIKRIDIDSGPAASVGACTDSVLDHAF